MRERSERLAIANQIAEKQRFHHWELEFADVFEQNSGFDLIIGNDYMQNDAFELSNLVL